VIEAFRRHKTPLHMDVELPTLQAIKRFVCMGNVWRWCPRSAWKTRSAGETVRVPVRDCISAQAAAGVSAESTLSHAERAF